MTILRREQVYRALQTADGWQSDSPLTSNVPYRMGRSGSSAAGVGWSRSGAKVRLQFAVYHLFADCLKAARLCLGLDNRERAI